MTAINAIPKPPSPSASDALVWNGSKWVSQKIAAATITAGAVGTTQLADGSIVTAKVADGAITALKIAGGVLGGGAPLSTTAKIFVHPTAGSDSNDGLSWLSPFATLGKAKTTIDATGYGDVYLAPGAVYDIASSLEVRQGMRIRGARGTLSAGGGSVIRYTGPDDGSSAIRTARDSFGTPTIYPDWSAGLIESVMITSQNTLTSGWGINLRNAQNKAILRDVYIGASATQATHSFGDGGVQFTDDLGGNDHAYPGYIMLDQVWVVGGKKAFKITSGFTTIIFNLCGVDGDAATMTDAVSVEQGNGVARSRDMSLQFFGFKYEGKGSDANAFHVSVDADVQIIGGVVKNQSTLTKSAILWDATQTSANDLGPSLVVDSLNSQGFPTWLSAPNLTPPITISPGVTSAGEVYRRSYHGQMVPPAAWDGTHHAIVADGQTINVGTASTTGLLINPAAGQTADLLALAAATVADSYTRTDSSSTMGTAETGGAYTAERGTWGISSNKAYLATSTDDASGGIIDGLAPDGTLTFDLTTAGTVANIFSGVQFRHIDVNNSLIVRFKGSTQELLVMKMDSSSQSTLATVGTMGYAASTTYAVKIVMTGAVIQVWFGGTLRTTYTLTGGNLSKFGTPTLLGYRVNGLTDNGVGGSRFDNLRYVTTLSRFDANGHLGVSIADTGTTKTTPGGVDKWMQVTVAGVTYYSPLYTSKTT